MTSFAVEHGPGNHNDGIGHRDRERLRGKLLEDPRTLQILSAIELGVRTLEQSYPERLEEYRNSIKGESLLRRLARELMEGSSACPIPPDGRLVIDEIAEVSNIREPELIGLLEEMHGADLLTRRQRVDFSCSSATGALIIYQPPEGLSYGLTEIARQILAK